MRSIRDHISRWTSPNPMKEPLESKSSRISCRPMVADVTQSSLSLLSTIPHNLHKMRRTPLNPFFSKRAVNECTGIIQSCVSKLCTRLEEYHASQTPVDLQLAYGALTVDVITLYCLGRSYGSLEKPDFDPQLGKGIASGGELRLLLKQFPWIFKVFTLLPCSIAVWLNRNAMDMVNRRRVTLSSARTTHGKITNPQRPLLPFTNQISCFTALTRQC